MAGARLECRQAGASGPRHRAEGPTILLSTDFDRHWQMRRRQVEDRERQLLDALEEMDPEQMRWTARLLADALTPLQWRTLLAGYHEALPAEQLRAFLERFIPECSGLAIVDLEALRGRQTGGVQDLIDLDLQNMSCREKWALIADSPRTLDPARTARELARVAMCLTPALFADPSLPRAAIEFSVYFELQQALQGLPAAEIYRLADAATLDVRQLIGGRSRDAGSGLEMIQHEIGRAAGLPTPIRDRLGTAMEPLPKGLFPPSQDGMAPEGIPAEAEREMEALGSEELLAELEVQADQLSLRESQEMLGPLRAQYPDLARMPAAELRRLVARIACALRGRGPSDFLQRCRTGRFLALSPLSGEVWNLLPHAERLRLLEQDNRALDIAQAARQLAKCFLSPDYVALADAAAQRRLVTSPRYSEVVRRLLQLPPQDGEPGVFPLHRRVTEMALGMEESPRETRGAQLEAIRRAIGGTLGVTGPSGVQG